MKSINPKNNQFIKEYTALSEEELRLVIHQVDNAWESWKDTPYAQRAILFTKLGEELEKNKEEYAGIITEEMGKVTRESISEIEKCAKVCTYYADHGEEFLTNQSIETEAHISKVSYQPLGIVLGIMPWNFPFWQVFRYAAPTMMAGNATVLKHAPNVFGCAEKIQQAFLNAGFPENVFKSLIISTDATEQLIEHSSIKAVTLTGSTRAGKAVAKRAGAHLKKTVLELGGSDPYVILEDADLEQAVDTCVKSRLLNVGQSCISAKRFIVVEEIYDDFIALFSEKMKEKTIGDPEADVDMGPIAREDLRDQLHDQVAKSIDKGATCLLGGEVPDREGFFYPPTILTDVSEGMPAYEEELFGPVASVIKAKDEEEAIRIANDTSYGLGAAVFTQDLKRGEEIAEKKLDAGCCFVNELVHSDPRLPFGGIKQSGYGRELGPLGIKEFVNAKTVYVK